MVLVGSGIFVVAALLLLLVFSMRPKTVERVLPATDELQSARNDLLNAPTLDALAAEAAMKIEKLVGATSGFVSLDDIEARSGRPLTITSQTVIELMKTSVVQQDQVTAIAISFDDRVVGFIAAKDGHTETLQELARFVTNAFAGHQPEGSRSLTLAVDPHFDSLTGIGNRRRFDSDLADVASQGNDELHPVSLAMFDIDDFRFYNEAHGKQAGNEVLRSVAALIASNLRESDVVYRYSGVKFVALLPGATVENGYAVVERIRSAVEATRFDGEEVQPAGRVTMSIGIAEAPSNQTGNLIQAADAALASAKESGRNKVVIEADIA